MIKKWVLKFLKLPLRTSETKTNNENSLTSKGFREDDILFTGQSFEKTRKALRLFRGVTTY